MQNLIAAVELAKENGYSMASLSEALGHNKNYVSRILSRGVSETTAETVTSEIEQLLAGAAPKQDKDKALKQALKTIELQGVAFQELESQYDSIVNAKLAVEENTVELAAYNHELTKQKDWAHTQLEQANGLVSGLRELNKKYKQDAMIVGMFAAFFGFMSASLLVALVYMVMK